MRHRIPAPLIGCLALRLNAWGAVGQGTFANLDFEQVLTIDTKKRSSAAHSWVFKVPESDRGWR